MKSKLLAASEFDEILEKSSKDAFDRLVVKRLARCFFACSSAITILLFLLSSIYAVAQRISFGYLTVDAVKLFVWSLFITFLVFFLKKVVSGQSVYLTVEILVTNLQKKGVDDLQMRLHLERVRNNFKTTLSVIIAIGATLALFCSISPEEKPICLVIESLFGIKKPDEINIVFNVVFLSYSMIAFFLYVNILHAEKMISNLEMILSPNNLTANPKN